jgi:hypothetical protein
LDSRLIFFEKKRGKAREGTVGLVKWGTAAGADPNSGACIWAAELGSFKKASYIIMTARLGDGQVSTFKQVRHVGQGIFV